MARPEQGSHSWRDVRAVLANASHRDLLSLVGELYALRKDNRDFLHARFVKDADVLAPYKEAIEHSISPAEPWKHPVRLSVGRKAISDYRKAVGNPDGLAELMLFYAECGVNFMLEFDHIDEPFFKSVVNVYADGLEFLTQCEQEVIDDLLPRFANTVQATEDMPLGIHEGFRDVLDWHFPDE